MILAQCRRLRDTQAGSFILKKRSLSHFVPGWKGFPVAGMPLKTRNSTAAFGTSPVLLPARWMMLNGTGKHATSNTVVSEHRKFSL